MKKSNTVKCRYSSCLHDTKELDKEEAVKVGSQYYHKDCYETKEQIKEIIDLFVKNVNPNPVYAQLQAVIKQIVFTRGIGSEYLLFGLKYYIKNKIPLSYPQGLYYVVQNKDVKNEYEKSKAKAIKSIEVNIEETNGNYFEYKPKKQKGFADIIGGQ